MARLLFFGTPDYARIILQGLLQRPDLVIRVVTKPDTPQGRRLKLAPSPVAQLALASGLHMDRPEKLPQCREAWREFAPDLIVTAAFGKILRPWLLQLPARGAFNLHASLLPRWRGPNPIAWAIRAGDQSTGVTLMAMDEGVDTGAVAAWAAVPIAPSATLGSLTEELAQAARALALENLDQMLAGRLALSPQSGVGATYAGKFDAGDARIAWTAPAREIDRLVHSMSPDPGAYTLCCGVRIKITDSAYDEGEQTPGSVTVAGNAWRVGTARGVLVVQKIKPAGRKEMTPGDFMRGLHARGEVVCE